MAFATVKVIDRNRKGEVIYEAHFCAEHFKTEAPHDLRGFEVTELNEAAMVPCTYAGLAPELRWAGYVDCAVPMLFPVKDAAVKVLAVLLVLILPALASAQSTPIILGNAADLVSTELAVRRAGIVEANPIMGRSPGQRVAVKAAATAAQVWMVQRIGRTHPTVAKVLGYGIGGLMGSVALHNARIGR